MLYTPWLALFCRVRTRFSLMQVNRPSTCSDEVTYLDYLLKTNIFNFNADYPL
jgi:hypothetical protein